MSEPTQLPPAPSASTPLVDIVPWRTAVQAAVQSHRQHSFDRLAPLLANTSDRRWAEAILTGVLFAVATRQDRERDAALDKEPIDPRWFDVALGFIGVDDEPLRHVAVRILLEFPPDSRVIEPLAALEPKLQFGPWGRLCADVVRALARVPDPRAVSILAKATVEGGDATDEARRALFRIDHPGAVGALQAYITKYEPWTNWKNKVDEARTAMEAILSRVGAEGALAARQAKAQGRDAAKAVKQRLNATKPLPPEPRTPVDAPTPLDTASMESLRKLARSRLKSAGLAAHEALLVRPAVLLWTERVSEDTIPIGATKIGGLPDLPKGENWLEYKGYVLSFIAQIRLEDIAALKLDLPLPKTGLLSFFILDEAVATSERIKVVHFEDTKRLRRAPPPKTFQATRKGIPARTPYAACRVELTPTVTMPPITNPLVTEGLNASEQKAYSAMKPIPHVFCNQLLGFRHQGYDASNPAKAWLLLRLTSDDQADMQWHDCDCLDVYVPEKGLAKGDFSKAYPYIGD